MLLTVSVKLLANSGQKAQLLRSIYQFNAACNWVSEYCFNNRLFSKFKVQENIYHELRQKFNLPSQFAIRVISRVCDSYTIDKKVQHTFKKNSSIEYDARILNWKKLGTISILSLDGRLPIPIAFGEYAKLYEKLSEKSLRTSAKLIYRNKEFYLQASIDVPEPPSKQVKEYLGVDLGIVNLATTSEGTTFSGEKTDANRKRYTKLKAKLQSLNTNSSQKKLKNISGKERRFKKDTNHVIAKRIIQVAKALGMGIAIEDLHNFKKTVRKEQREQFGKWAFGELTAFIEYKARLEGIPVIKVDPRNTSRTCSCCGFCDKKNRKSQALFICQTCGYTINADLNAAKNISFRAAVNQPIVAIKKQHPAYGRMSDKLTTLVVSY